MTNEQSRIATALEEICNGVKWLVYVGLLLTMTQCAGLSVRKVQVEYAPPAEEKKP